MNDIAFVSVAFGDKRYIKQQMRLIESIDKFHPDSVGFHWTDALPPGSKKFLNSLYGFKVHAVLHALNQGYQKIIWIDPACYLLDRIDFYFEWCKQYGVLAIQDDNKLPASDSALSFFKYKRNEIQDFHLVGGSMYVFNFPYSESVFKLWHRAELLGIFGSQFEEASDKLQGHRADESCMALSLYKNGSRPLPYTGSRYNWDANAAIKKEHFK